MSTPGNPAVAADRRGELFDPSCPTRHLLDRVGSKWTTMAILVMADRGTETRFAELQRAMPGVSKKMLAQTLRSLERDGLVTRRVEDSVPPRVHYGLTGRGKTLVPPLRALREWAETHMWQIQEDGRAHDQRSLGQ